MMKSCETLGFWGLCLDYIDGASNTGRPQVFLVWFVNMFWSLLFFLCVFFSDHKWITYSSWKMLQLNIKKKIKYPQYRISSTQKKYCCTLVNFLHFCVYIFIGYILSSWDYIVYRYIWRYIYIYSHKHFLMLLQLFVYNSFCACIVIYEQ